MADENVELEKKSSDGKGLILVLITFVILLIVAVAVATFFLFSSIGTNSKADNNEQKIENTKQSSTPEAKFKADVSDLVLNLTDTRGREKILKLSFSIRSLEPTIQDIVTNHLPEITDIVITQVSSRSSEELLTVGGKNILKDELISELNGVMNYARNTSGNIVDNIFFTAFVIK